MSSPQNQKWINKEIQLTKYKKKESLKMYFLSPQYYYTAGSDHTPCTTFNFRVMQVGLAFGVNYHDKNDFFFSSFFFIFYQSGPL